MTATFTKLNSGAWGIRAEQMNAPRPGQILPVTKKDGSSQDVTVAAVLWSKGRLHLCSIESDKAERSAPARRSQGAIGRTYQRRYGWDGIRGSSSYYSSGMYDEES